MWAFHWCASNVAQKRVYIPSRPLKSNEKISEKQRNNSLHNTRYSGKIFKQHNRIKKC